MITRKHTFALVAFALVIAVSSSSALASTLSYSYSYARQSLSNINFSGGSFTEFDTLNSAVINNGIPSGADAQLGTTDALQALVGTVPGENSFTAYGQQTPDYARGDALVSATTADNVAETYLTTPLADSGSSGTWVLAQEFTLGSSGTVSLAVDYMNEIDIDVVLGDAEAEFSFEATIIDNSTGNVVMSWATAQLNLSGAVLGTGSFSTGLLSGQNLSIFNNFQLAAGEYTLTLEGDEVVFASVVPEPTSMMMAGMGLVALAGLGANRIRNRRN